MNDAIRTILIALGGALILLVAVPLLFRMGMMDGESLWAIGALGLLALVVGSVLIVIGVGRNPWDRR